MKLTGNNLCFLDSNIVIDLFRGDQKIGSLLSEFDDVYLSTTVLGELYYGALASAMPGKRVEEVSRFSRRCKVIAIDEDTSAIYGKLKNILRKAGKPIPDNDIWIAAHAVQFKIPLVTKDNHFKYLSADLKLIDFR